MIWDKAQAGAGTDRGSIDSAGAPNVTAPVESVLVFYRGQWKRSGPAAMPHEEWLDLCGPRGLWRFPGTSDPLCPAPFPEQLPERCITLFSFPGDVVADPFVGRDYDDIEKDRKSTRLNSSHSVTSRMPSSA